MHLVHQHYAAVLLAELVLGVHEDEPALRRHLAAPCEEGAGVGLDLRIVLRAHQAAGLDGHELRRRQLFPAVNEQAARQVGDAPEEEQNTRGRQQGAHGVHPIGHLRRVAGKLREEIGREHEEGCTGRVTDFHLIACGDKLRTVPERGCRFDGRAIDKGGNEEREPPHDIVYESELFHVSLLFYFEIVVQR